MYFLLLNNTIVNINTIILILSNYNIKVIQISKASYSKFSLLLNEIV